MGLTRESRKIAAAVIGLGQSLGLTTVAEGVERRNQADMLLWLGCDVGQGWLFGRPVPESRLADTLGTELFPQDDTEQEAVEYGPLAPSLHLPSNQRLAQLEAIYDGIPVGLCFLDPSLRFLSVNRCLTEMTRLSVAEHLGRTVQEVLPHAFAHFGPVMYRCLKGESPGQMEVLGRPDPKGEQRRYLLLMEPARDEAGEVIGISVALIENTHRGTGPTVLPSSPPLPHGIVVPLAANGNGTGLQSSATLASS